MEFVDTKETGAIMRKSPNALAVMRHRGQGPAYYYVNGRVLYDREEVEAWIKSQGVGSMTVTRSGRATMSNKGGSDPS